MTEREPQDREEVGDRELVRRARGGDAAAFGRLVQRHQKRLWNFLATWVPEPEDREDLLQEVCMAAYRGIDGFRGEARFSTWLFQIGVNQARGHRRRLARRPRAVELPELEGEERLADDDPRAVRAPTAPTPTAPADEQVDHKHIQRRVWELVERLPEDWQAVVRLRFLEEMTYPEIAEAVGSPVGTVKAQVHRGRLRLVEWLAEEGIRGEEESR